jgi:hypothetical protein
VDKSAIKDLTFDFVLLFINETALLELCPSYLLMMCWFDSLLLPKEKLAAFILKPLSLICVISLSTFDLPFNILNCKILFIFLLGIKPNPTYLKLYKEWSIPHLTHSLLAEF